MKRHICAALAIALSAVGTVGAAESGVYANVDFLLLSPQIPTVAFDNFFYNNAPTAARTDGSFSDGIDLGMRTTIGAEDCCGFGGRFRWFTFDQDYDYTGVWDTGTPIALNGGFNLDVDAFDFEFTQRGDFCNWNLQAAAGLRYGSLEVRNNNIDFSIIPAALFLLPGVGVDFDGVGPTLALQGNRQLGCSGFSLFASGRTSLLFGDTDITTPFLLGGNIAIQDDMVNVTEIQIGVNHERCLNECYTLTSGIFWETQRWDSDSGALGDVGFMGLGLRSGLRY